MNVNELIRLLEKVKTKGATVYVHNSSHAGNEIYGVIVQHDMSDDEVTVVLKVSADD